MNSIASLPKVRILDLLQGSGVSAGRNFGIEAARGDLIGFCDSDDLWLPGWVESATAALDDDRTAHWVLGRHFHLLPDGTRTEAPSLAAASGLSFSSQGRVLHTAPRLTRTLISQFTCHISATIVRRDLIQKVGSFPTNLLYLEDVLAWVRMSQLSPLIEIDRFVSVYRRGIPSASTSWRALTAQAISGWDVARHDPTLRDFRKELRWTSYSARKTLALKNLYYGNRMQALRFAAAALVLDPREIGEFMLFLTLMRSDKAMLRRRGGRYSQSIDDTATIAAQLGIR